MTRLPRLAGKRLLGAAIAAAIVLCLGGLLVWGYVAGRSEAGSEAEREKPIRPQSRVATENGRTVLTIDAATQRRSGIESAPPGPGPVPSALHAYGTVLDLQPLTALRNDILDAKAQADAQSAKLAAARQAFERSKKLFRDQQNVSAAQMQAAEAAYLADQAALASAQSRSATLASTARQAWGPVLGDGLVSGSALITGLIARRTFLLQVTLPPGIVIDHAPSKAALRLGDGKEVGIDYVSPATRTDPKIQGLGFLYAAPAEPGLLPGLDVEASLPMTAAPPTAVVVPPSAIVWVDGKAWFYLRSGPQTFQRQPAGSAAPNGGFLQTSLPPGAEIVTRGAQALLSEEFRAQVQVGD